MTVPATITEHHRHRLDPENHPDRVPWPRLADALEERANAELAWLVAAGEVRMVGAGHGSCALWHGVTRCGGPGLYRVQGYGDRVFCGPDAVSRAAIRIRLVRAVRDRNETTQQLPVIGEL